MPAAPRPDQRDPRRTGRAGSRSARRRAALRARHPARAIPRAGARRSCPDQRARTPPGSCAWTGSAPARPRRADPPPASAHLHCWWPSPRSIHPVRWRSTRAPAGRGKHRAGAVAATASSRTRCPEAAAPPRCHAHAAAGRTAGKAVRTAMSHADARTANRRCAHPETAPAPPAAPAPRCEMARTAPAARDHQQVRRPRRRSTGRETA